MERESCRDRFERLSVSKNRQTRDIVRKNFTLLEEELEIHCPNFVLGGRKKRHLYEKVSYCRPTNDEDATRLDDKENAHRLGLFS